MQKQAPFPAWFLTLFQNAEVTEVWSTIAEYVLTRARQGYNPGVLSSDLLPLDRALSEAAWELWESFPDAAPRTAAALQEWWSENEAAPGRAVLILDALSLRELPLLLQLFREKGVEPLTIQATAAESPTDTDHFAAILGLPGRFALARNDPQGLKHFTLESKSLFTAVFDYPFKDCVAQVRASPDVFIWHSRLDNELHPHSKNADAFEKLIRTDLMEERGKEEFWEFIQILRKGRRLLITSDHGYADTRYFASVETGSEGSAMQYLQRMLRGSRCQPVTAESVKNYVPPVLLTRNHFHIALGLRTWKVPGGHPEILHGGLSLLEAFVPFIELAEER